MFSVHVGQEIRLDDGNYLITQVDRANLKLKNLDDQEYSAIHVTELVNRMTDTGGHTRSWANSTLRCATTWNGSQPHLAPADSRATGLNLHKAGDMELLGPYDLKLAAETRPDPAEVAWQVLMAAAALGTLDEGTACLKDPAQLLLQEGL